jgi:hypothetical protein
MQASIRNLVLAASGAAVALAVALPLAPATAGHLNTVLNADLDGRTEVATDAGSKRVVGDPDGTGDAYVFGIDGDPNTLCYVLTVDGIGTATAAHIHRGAAGTNGPVVVNLAAPGDGDAADCLTEGEEGKFVAGQTVAEILANPGGFYVNVHTAAYPGGAVRGQLGHDR